MFEQLRDLPRPWRLAGRPGFVRSLGYASDLVWSQTLLATPMRHRAEHVGHFFLAGKQGDGAFTDEDEEVVTLFAGGGHRGDPELDRLSNIIQKFNDLFGGIEWDDVDRGAHLIAETIPARVAADTAFRNAQMNSDQENARIEHDRALLRVMTSMMKNDNQLFKQFMNNDGFTKNDE